MRDFSGGQQFNALKDAVTDSYRKVFPIEKDGYTLDVGKLWVDDQAIDVNDFGAQKKARLAGSTWGAPLYASIVLRDPSGKVIDELKQQRLATIPRLTPRGSYIVGGNEYQVNNQLRRKPGVYVQKKGTGDQFKTNFKFSGEKVRDLELDFDPVTNRYNITKVGGSTSKIPLYPFLKALNASDDDLKKEWGDKVFEANKSATRPNDLMKLAEKLTGQKHETPAAATIAIQDFAKRAGIDPKIAKITLGAEHSNLNSSVLMSASKKLLGAYKGTEKTDDPESLLFKEVLSVEDMIRDKFEKKHVRDLRYTLGKQLGKETSLKKIINVQRLTNPLESFFSTDDRSSTPEQYNPVQMLSNLYKLTMTGTGGITDPHTIVPEVREVHPTHVGFVDPTHTPDGAKIGTMLHMTAGTVKDGRDIKTRVYNVKTGKMEFLSPLEMYSKTVAFPEDFKFDKTGKIQFDKKEIRAQKEGKVFTAAPHTVDYVIPSPQGLFSYSTNLVPFLQNDQGTRVMMASKMLEQAIPLVHREPPHVQTQAPDGKTFVDHMGDAQVVRAPHDGVVTKIDPDYIMVGNTKLHLYNHFPLNQKTFIHHEVKVKVGDKVKAGQLLADSNFTKDAKLAIGKNLKVAYLPYPGLTFEDGIVITESASKKLATQQVYKSSYTIKPGQTETNFKRFNALQPGLTSTKNKDLYDADGIIKKGTVIEPGTITIMGLKYELDSIENASLKRINKSLQQPWTAHPVRYTGEFQGVVSDVVKRGDEVTVYVQATENARESDKLSGVHGNKGVISRVIPDSEAPRTKDGKIPDVFLNPHGIIGRINLGQLFESAASKIAQKTGKPYVVKNFDGSRSDEKVVRELKEHGLEDQEEMFLPNGKSLGKVSLGDPYILRLAKTGKTGFSARMPGTGYDQNMQPLRGGEEGTKSMDPMTIYSMLSHGAKKNLIDAHQKSEKNDDYWRALEMGRVLPAPKPTFAYNKFMNLIRGAGINPQKNGAEITLAPMTDSEVKKISNGKISEYNFLLGKDLTPKKGGFFDEGITGGILGNRFSHMELHDKLPNPIFEKAIKSLTGLNEARYMSIVNGTAFVDEHGGVIDKKTPKSVTGGAGIERLLKNINMEEKREKLVASLKTAKASDLNGINKQIRYLDALKDLKLTPDEAYMRKLIPIIPPAHRPVYEMPGKGLVVAPSNYLYQNVGILSQSHEYPVMKLLKDEEKKDLREATYKATRALAGLEPVETRGKDVPIEGFVSQITGGSPKTGFFMEKVITKKQDLTGRGVIIAAPSLGIDEIGIPEKMAWKIFHPFIMREYSLAGIPPLTARKEVEDQTPRAKKFLEYAMNKRTVLANRAPSLHRFSIMAFKPKLTDGLAIEIPPLVLKGFGGDYDGDCALCHVLVRFSAAALERINIALGTDFLNSRSMTARYKEAAAFRQNDQVFAIDLEDFPTGRLVSSREGTNGKIDLYEAVKGTEVLSFEEKSGRVEWKPVAYWSKHYDREIEIVNLSSGRQIYTDHDPRAVYGVEAGSLICTRNTPTDALKTKMLVPRSKMLDLPVTVFNVSTKAANGACNKKARLLKEEITLDSLSGYYFGAICGDGWVDDHKGVCLAAITSEIAEKVQAAIDCFFNTESPQKHTRESFESYGKSIRHVFPSVGLADFTAPLVGHLARGKHLPPFFLMSPKDFREGLLAGLMDTDGCVSISTVKDKRPQFMASMTSSSLRMAREVVLLAQSLKITAHITKTHTPAGLDFWMVYFSGPEFLGNWDWSNMTHPKKLEIIRSAPVQIESSVRARQDLVPMSKELAAHVCLKMGAKRNAPTERKTVYSHFHRAKREGYLSRQSARRVFEYLKPQDILEHKDGAQWLSIVENESITWERVVSVEKTGIRETGYDLTVPGYETFTNVEGVVLSNTMTIHVPTSEEALKESHSMFPSRNLFKPGTRELMISPSQESAIGLYFLSQNKEGLAKINSLLPAKFHIDHVLDEKSAKAFYNKLAKEDPQAYAHLVMKLRDLGDKHAYESGFSVGLKDVAVNRASRDKDFAEADKKVEALKKLHKPGDELDAKVAKIYQDASEKAYHDMKPELASKKNNFYTMVTSGARGKATQLMQMISAPGVMKDAKERSIPVPVKRSYAEGLHPSDYFIAAYGVRKGMMDRSLQTALPGALNKDIMATTIDNIITEQDCGTEKGHLFGVNDRDLYNRYLAKDQYGLKRNTLVTPQVISQLNKAGAKMVLARSPLECLAKKGTCVHCYGLNEHGKNAEIGDNVGVVSGQAMSEPMTQMVMKTFHSGGVATGGSIAQGFERVTQLTKLPNYIAGEAAMATHSGKITKITPTPAGGHEIFVGGVAHAVRPGIIPTVKVGDTVKAGDKLSAGVLKPQDLVKHVGMRAAQNYLVDELKKVYDESLKENPMERKNIETVVRSFGNLTRVMNAPKHSDFSVGDVIPFTVADHYNATRKVELPVKESVGYHTHERMGNLPPLHQITEKDLPYLHSLSPSGNISVLKDPLKHAPILKGIEHVPELRKDWLSQLGYRYIRNALTEGASEGWKSNLEGTHPIPALAYGATFGKKKEHY